MERFKMNNGSTCQLCVKQNDGLRWVRLTLSVKHNLESDRFLIHSSCFTCDIQARDEIAANYTLENWEAGVISGALFGYRRAKRPPGHVVLSELIGVLRSDDMPTLAEATAFCVGKILGNDEPEWGVAGWEIEVKRLALVANDSN